MVILLLFHSIYREIVNENTPNPQAPHPRMSKYRYSNKFTYSPTLQFSGFWVPHSFHKRTIGKCRRLRMISPCLTIQLLLENRMDFIILILIMLCVILLWFNQISQKRGEIIHKKQQKSDINVFFKLGFRYLEISVNYRSLTVMQS